MAVPSRALRAAATELGRVTARVAGTVAAVRGTVTAVRGRVAVGRRWRHSSRRLLADGGESVEDRDHHLDSFVRMMAHDLRNPIDVARIRMEAARDTGEDVHFEKALGAIERIEELVDEFDSLVAAERLDVERNVAVATVAYRAWDTVDTRGARLEVGDPGPVDADPNALRRLFENLFRNSTEHGSTGSRSKTDDSVEHGSTGNRSKTGDAVEHGSTASRSETGDEERPSDADRDTTTTDGGTTDVTVTVDGTDGGFYVADDGVGIPAERRDQVFEPGFSTRDGGTGLGLEIVERIAVAHDWTTTLTESDDGGVRVEFGTEDGTDRTA